MGPLSAFVAAGLAGSSAHKIIDWHAADLGQCLRVLVRNVAEAGPAAHRDVRDANVGRLFKSLGKLDLGAEKDDRAVDAGNKFVSHGGLPIA